MRAGRDISALRPQPGADGGIELPGACPGQTVLSTMASHQEHPETADVPRHTQHVGRHLLSLPGKPPALGLLKVRPPPPLPPHLRSNPGGSGPKLRIDPAAAQASGEESRRLRCKRVGTDGSCQTPKRDYYYKVKMKQESRDV